jgi:rhodanese-related sulfurtransferase
MNTTSATAFKELRGQDFKAQFEQTPNAVLVDVRTAMEHMSGNIPNSINLDIMDYDFHSTIAELDKTKTYFVYCRSGNRSTQACMIMNEMGLNTINLEGGIGAWPH